MQVFPIYLNLNNSTWWQLSKWKQTNKKSAKREGTSLVLNHQLLADRRSGRYQLILPEDWTEGQHGSTNHCSTRATVAGVSHIRQDTRRRLCKYVRDNSAHDSRTYNAAGKEEQHKQSCQNNVKEPVLDWIFQTTEKLDKTLNDFFVMKKMKSEISRLLRYSVSVRKLSLNQRTEVLKQHKNAKHSYKHPRIAINKTLNYSEVTF